MPSDLRTQATVLRRVNYGESDRILHLLTPEGKFAVVAKGVRKEKSRLAGGIELFGIADVVIHHGRSDLGTLTSAKMLRFFPNLIADLKTLELASGFLKQIDRVAEHADNSEYFTLLEESLATLDLGVDRSLVQVWFALNLARALGEEVNFVCDVSGQPLVPDSRYSWDSLERALRPDPSGKINASVIKFARFLTAHRLKSCLKIQGYAEFLPEISLIVHTLES